MKTHKEIFFFLHFVSFLEPRIIMWDLIGRLQCGRVSTALFVLEACQLPFVLGLIFPGLFWSASKNAFQIK